MSGCNNNTLLSKVSFLAMLPASQLQFFENMDDSDWQIASFDSATRIVCVEIYNIKIGSEISGAQAIMVSVVLPELAWNA